MRLLVTCAVVACSAPSRTVSTPPAALPPAVVIMAQVEPGVYRALPMSDPRVAPAQRAFETPPLRRLLALLDATRRMRRNDPPPAGVPADAWARALAAPFYLSVEGELEEHGGAGFVLRTDAGDVANPATPFVELSGSAAELAKPLYATALVHESTHALFALAAAQWFAPCAAHPQVCGRVPSAFHDVQRPTQPGQAVNEGYAEHMEALAFLDQRGADALAWLINPATQVAAARGFVSPRGRRIDHVIWNRAVFAPARVPEDAIARDGLDAAHRAYQDSQPIDDHRLRTCREMLSTEGAVASLLVRLALDDELAGSLPEPLRALVPPDAVARLGIGGAVELRMLYLLARMPAVAPAETAERGVRELIELWRTTFPADAPAVTRVVVTWSLGATSSAALAARLRALLATPVIVPARDPKRNELGAASKELLALAPGDGLFAACGPPLWVAVPGKTLCGDFGGPCLPLEIDLNAASELDLRLLPGVDAAAARRAIEAREKLGYFPTREAALTAAGLSREAAATIAARPEPGLPVE